MAVRSFGAWDYVIFAICLCISASIGVYHAFFGGGQHTTEKYYYGNRNMGALPVALSMLVTYQSSIFMLGYPGEMYIYGSMFWLSFVGVGLGFILVAVFEVPLLHPLNIRSAFEYLELRYKSSAPRKLASFMSVILYAIFMGLVVYGPAITLKTVTEFPLWASMVIVAAGGIFYTSIGGFKAVIWADVFQSIIIIIGIFAILIQGLIRVGGSEEVWRINEMHGRIQFDEFSPDITVRHTVWGMVIANMIQFFSLGFSQMIVQRIMSTPTTSKAMQASIYAVPGFALFGSISCFLGLMAFAYNVQQGCDPLAKKIIVRPEQVLPYFVMDIFDDIVGMPGVFLAALFSASLSTLSSGLNSLPTITWEDFIKPHCGKRFSDVQATLFGKVLVVIFGSLAIGFAYLVYLLGGPIVQMTSTVTSCINGPILGMFVMGAVFKSANAKGAIVGCLSGFLFLLWIAVGQVIQKFATPKLPGGPVTNCSAPSYVYNVNSSMTAFGSETTYSMNYSTTDSSPGIPPTSSGGDGVLGIYKISYIWYTTLGMVVCILVGMIVSLLTGGLKSADDVELKYLFPLRRMLDAKRVKQYELNELKEKEVETEKETSIELITQKA
ncbi:sodium-dependent multivitamin transporter-like isoform X1 [Ostrea edulis]|uniref:sodium-dependent multivitamin transporter-like isoform X1 n=1 Tax=Ostrea edulis TaxID=37623 RepID=UPI002094AD4C|nr:sodium-dependent multivitamin transporter-like isoform X1 [Ostrea edulis]XP_048749500.1 sodium-dependent multivitamin transporter-like isoform X1 [Ostrea edulis]XP_048749501.1 sodium-dependent multivitamin transporter-like isoform X1 [Ostrea edulis]XP_048749502.1 sodium-dependent multivitamin transporter-like isoform X1 [Ostrea edulis]